MADGTKIEWTDATVNAVNGCSVLSPGCTNCYAMKQAHRFDIRRGLTKQSKGGMVWTGEVRFNEKQLLQPLNWKRPRKIFWNAHGDLFHESVPDAWIDRCFAVMALTPHHTHQVLTKRSARMREYLSEPGLPGRLFGVAATLGADGVRWSAAATALATTWPLPNVWCGVSVEDQTRADERIPDLLATPAAVRWLSGEPLLGPVDIIWALSTFKPTIAAGFLARGLFSPGMEMLRPLNWVVAGGESGPGARPMHPDWARSLRDQCAAAGVPFFMKQLSGPKGRAVKNIDQFPEDLRVREWPR
jgi:protein gp37